MHENRRLRPVMRKDVNLFRLKLLGLLYFFLIIQSYETVIGKFLGSPIFVLIEFAVLVTIGLFIQRPDLLEAFPFRLKHLRYCFLFVLLFNFWQLLFGSYFALFNDSWVYAFILLTPFLVLFKSKGIPIVGIILTLGTTFVGIVNKFPLNYAGGMLCYIDSALNILINGGNPYLQEVHVLGGYIEPSFGYMPLMLLSALPFKLIGVDIRYLNVACAVIFVLFYYIITKKEVNSELWQAYALAFFSLLTAPYVYLLITTKHIFFYGLLIFLLTFYAERKPWFFKSAFLALAVSTRQFAAVLGLPVLWEKPKAMLKNVVIVAGILVIIFLPFMSTNPIKFVDSISAKSAFTAYDGMPVDFGSRFSPGGGSSFNIGHLAKYLYPGWSAKINMLTIIMMFLILGTLLSLRKIGRIPSTYYFYLVLMAFSVVFSQHHLWGLFCVAWASVYSLGSRNK